ncbi:MAG TPA: cobalamin-binding protein [Candidatus Acidoferrum sp.]|nr:cobalamin-binding protein [Candidatus Acidoferrum sp.]
MRIVSLLPSATETLFALGLSEEIVGVSHECDFPPQAASKRMVIRSRLPHGAPPAEIDRLVREYVSRGESLYAVDTDALLELAPDLIVTQDLCQVCAASPDDLASVLRKFEDPPEVLCLNPRDLGDAWRDILWIGEATCRGHEAEALLKKIGTRLGELETQIEMTKSRPRVAFLEWLQPFYVAGHWVPEMLELAGGRDVLGRKCTASFRVLAEDVMEAAPDVLFIAQCGYSMRQARDEYLAMSLPKGWEDIPAVRNGEVYALDASGYFSRPGPRLIAGLEGIARVLHPAITVGGDARSLSLRISQESSAPRSIRVATA